MAAPIASKVILPSDTGNTGKNVRTQTRVVGADTVHEHYFVPTSARSTLGVHRASSGILTPTTAAHNGTTTGLAWLINPVGSGVKVALKRVTMSFQFAALAVDMTVGEIRGQLMTFSGVASAGVQTPGKRDSTDAASVATFRTASTGLTISLGGVMRTLMMPTMDLLTGGAGHWNPYDAEYAPGEEEDEFVLRAGEGVAFWNAAALTTANRRAIINIIWEEFE